MSINKEEVRCPYEPRALLAKVIMGDDPKRFEDVGQLVELYCRDCTKQQRKYDKDVARVLHRFNILGQLVETVVERGRLDGDF